MDNCEFNTSNLKLVFHKTIESRREELHTAVEGVIEIVKRMPCACEDLEEIQLALEEAMANAIIHGNRENPTKKVEICVACEGQEQLLLVVTDEGGGFDPSLLPDPTMAQNIFSIHGRGVFLINRLMDQVEFRHGGRQVVLRKKRP